MIFREIDLLQRDTARFTAATKEVDGGSNVYKFIHAEFTANSCQQGMVYVDYFLWASVWGKPHRQDADVTSCGKPHRQDADVTSWGKPHRQDADDTF